MRIQAVLRRNPAEAVRMLDAALARHPLSTMPALDRPYANLITAYAVAGQPARARQLLNEYRTMVPESIRRSALDSHAAAGYVALAENHPADAVTEFRQQWDESGCTACALADMGRAFDLLKQPDSAIAVYRRNAESSGGLLRIFADQWDLAQSYRRLGELYEEKGNREKALDYYGRFVQLWKEADPELQPQVRDVKERMTRLAGEKK
jgi:tetratricopeptide (TPR) repeat protein